MKRFERVDALAQARLQLAPLVRRDDARNEVERDQALGAGAVLVLGAVDGEGDADAPEDQLGLLAARAHHLRRLLVEPAVVPAVVLADRTARAPPHLVEAQAIRWPPWGEGSKVRATEQRYPHGDGRLGAVPVARAGVALAARLRRRRAASHCQAPQRGAGDDAPMPRSR